MTSKANAPSDLEELEIPGHQFICIDLSSESLDQMAQQFGEIDRETKDRILWLVGDDENSFDKVRQIILVAQKLEEIEVDPVDWVEKYREISKAAEHLANLLEDVESPHATRIRTLSEQAEEYCESWEAEGPLRRSNTRTQRFIAEALCGAIEAGMEVQLSSHPKSDLAGLFCVCCKAVGKKVTKNTSYYLKDPVQHTQKKLREKAIRTELANLREKFLEGKLDKDEYQRWSAILQNASQLHS